MSEGSNAGLAYGDKDSSRSNNTPIQSNTSDGRSPQLLPPIGKAEIGFPGTPASLKSPTESKARFHAGCVPKQSIYMDWNSVRADKKKHSVKYSRQKKTKSLASFKDAEEQETISHYLNRNKDYLETYILESVPQDVVEKWLHMKMKNNAINVHPKLSYNRPSASHEHSRTTKQMFMDILKIYKEDPREHTVLWQLAKSVATSIGVETYRVYKLFPDHPTFVQHFVIDHTKLPQNQPVPSTLERSDPQQVELVLEVAKKGTSKRVSRFDDPLRFPETPLSLLKSCNSRNKQGNYILYQPIITKSGKTSYVLEMWRTKDRFKVIDEEISGHIVVWGSVALHYCKLYVDKKRERNMSDFLLDVVKAIFEEMVSLDQLIKRILEFAQRLVNADRASLFLVDYRNSELVSTVFDLKFEPGLDLDMEKKEIRMPINRGIAGHVALSGETMNIPDAYSDYRFNRDVDEATGYKTISILCMPIKVEGKVIGVVQMVNKRDDKYFGDDDEAAFEIFSTFFGLALHHARLYDRIMRKEQKYRVALEVLSYHNTCREYEVQAMLLDKEPLNVDFADFYLDPFRFDEFEKCKCIISMFRDLFDMTQFDITTLTRFTLTVKKNYRTVPYHNFDHGWTVAHAMYAILKSDVKERFDYNKRLALFVACLCHDLDHRGYTNKYMSETASPLAAMYTTSTLEHHHFNITVTILQQDGHNIFSHISSEDYKEILGFIRHCILATDLAAFFPNLDKIRELYRSDEAQFSWDDPSHRDLAMAISMTAADLSASAKPWEIQIKTVKVIFEEFYDQGDKERAAGRIPIPMMDRNKPEEQPASQVGFLSQICIPCYDMLYRILPNTKPMYAMATKNLNRWKARADKILFKQDSKKDNSKDTLEPKDGIGDDDDDVTVKNEGNKRVEIIRQESKTIIGEAQPKPVVWNDDEEFAVEQTFRSNIWKEIDGVTWIEEEGVLVASEATKKDDTV
ncbi:probable 3',5'-cyclic phosphodiesterase pde-5 [Bombyx mandarina]|uniref:Phosphodiesterase n=1 Tax=Bombyx mandarina TaxID=7092 RepID=A0A6J2JZN4_BOMMA|nr:probable 3',5'-cyclic phosphodiesterase pde-5 [Bombyx mandarina]